MPRVALVLLCGGLAFGCRPTCGELCGKLERCGATGEVEQRECEESCTTELGNARDLDDKQTLEAFNARRACIGTTSCDGILAGECFAEDGSFPYERDPA